MLKFVQRTGFRLQRGNSTSTCLMSKKAKGKNHTDVARPATEQADSSLPVRLSKTGQVQILVQATPGSKHNAVVGIEERIRVAIAAPATEGKANKELLLYLAMVCGVKKSQVDLVSGQKSREKVISVSGSSADEVLRQIQQTYKDKS